MVEGVQALCARASSLPHPQGLESCSDVFPYILRYVLPYASSGEGSSASSTG